MPEKSVSGQNLGKSWQQPSAARPPQQPEGNPRGVNRPRHRHSQSRRRGRGSLQPEAPPVALPRRALQIRALQIQALRPGEPGLRLNPNPLLFRLAPCLPAFTSRLRPCLVCRLSISSA
jgi:hypothetical protein